MTIQRTRSGSRPNRSAAPRQPEGPPAPIKRVLALFTPYRARIVLVSLIIGASAVIALGSPLLLREMLDTAIPQANLTLVTTLAAGMIAIAVATNILGVVQTWMSNTIGQDLMHGLRVRVYGHLQRQSLSFFAKTRTGEVQSRIANDIGSMQSVVTDTATAIAQNSATVIATVIALLILDWRLALFSLAILPIFVRVARRIGSERREIIAHRQQVLGQMSVQVEESLSVSGILLGKTTGAGSALNRRFADNSRDLSKAELASVMSGKWRMATIAISFAAMPALVYWFAGLTIGNGNSVSVGTLVAVTTLQTQLFRPVMSLLSVGVEVQSSMALFGRVFEYLDLPIEIANPAQPRSLPPAAVGAGRTVAFNNVSFRYPDAERDALSGVDVTIPAGHTLAIVGATGAGKTTIGYLAARLHDPTTGSVTIDGVDLRDLSLETVADTVGVVNQETYLFHASIRENLRFAKPDASDADIENAARIAQIHDYIAGLPDGYDTMVGERGYRFSGGEKQRLSIARTVLRNPPVLVLDEATSALDNQTERAVQDALDDLMAGRTTIVVAHRLSTVRNADRILVLDRGRIVQLGSHDQLAAIDGAYRRLLNSTESELR